MRLRVVAAVLLTVVVLIAGTAWVTAQVVRVDPVTPKVLAGDDIGFRVEGLRGNTPVGTLVVRINGEWVPADIAQVQANIRP